jgi:translation initiation factor 2B subunit (eIF-2B alpha/beta/delta family)
MVVLVHGYSRVVSSVLVAALQRDRRFTVIVTEARPEPTGFVHYVIFAASSYVLSIVW